MSSFWQLFLFCKTQVLWEADKGAYSDRFIDLLITTMVNGEVDNDEEYEDTGELLGH